MVEEYRKKIVQSFDVFYEAVRSVSERKADAAVLDSLPSMRDAFLGALQELPAGTDIASVLDIDMIYALMDMLSGSMDAIAAEEEDEEGWNRFMDTVRDLISR